jgi:hypothetical protein
MQQPVYTDNSTITGDGTEEHPLRSGGGGGSPGGNTNDIQYNNAGAFAGSDDLQFFPNGFAQGELFIFSASDGGNAQIFAGSNSLEGFAGAVYMQGDGGLCSIDINLTNQGGITIQNNDTAFAEGIIIIDNSGGNLSILESGGIIQIGGNNGVGCTVRLGINNSDQLAFFGSIPAFQQPAPTTLAEVIAILAAYGLTA